MRIHTKEVVRTRQSLETQAVQGPRLSGVCHHTPGPGWHIPMHSHPHHEIIVVIEGAQTARIQNKIYRAQTGDILFYPAGVGHEEWSDIQDPVRSIFFALEWDMGTTEIPLYFHDENGRVRAMCAWILHDQDSDFCYARMAPGGIAQIMVAEFLRLTAPRQFHLVAKIRAFMRERMAFPIQLQDLANHAGLGKFYFLRRYKELTGTTPMQDLRRIRLESARSILVTSRMPLRMIAPMVGFADEYQLSHLFRKHFNTSPTEMRRELTLRSKEKRVSR